MQNILMGGPCNADGQTQNSANLNPVNKLLNKAFFSQNELQERIHQQMQSDPNAQANIESELLAREREFAQMNSEWNNLSILIISPDS